jgi:hypothetical protein
MAASYLVGAVIRHTSTSKKGEKMSEKKHRLTILKKAGIQVNPETAEIDWFSDVAGFWFDDMANEEPADHVDGPLRVWVGLDSCASRVFTVKEARQPSHRQPGRSPARRHAVVRQVDDRVLPSAPS